jgi:hypothetical protein
VVPAAGGTQSAPGIPAASGGISIARTTVYELGSPDAEVVSLARDGSGHLIWVSCPAPSCGGDETESQIEILEHRPGIDEGLQQRSAIPLGIGEVTSVAAHPSGSFAVAVQKNSSAPSSGPGRLILLGREGILGTVEIGVGPDAVAVSPTGELAVVACEAEPPDPEDCPSEEGEPDRGGSIDILDLRSAPASAKVIARVSAREIFERFLRDEPERAARPEDVEPEFAAVSSDGTTALVTLQEQSAVCVLDLRPVLAGGGDEACLADALLLPHGIRDAKGRVRGAHPDGIAFSPDGAFAITANEAHSKARELQGLSVIDLRGGVRKARIASTHSIFDLDSGLRGGESKARKAQKVRFPDQDSRRAGKGAGWTRPGAGPSSEVRPGGKLPRLDPEGIAIATVRERTLAAIAIERRAPGEEGGSVLLLDVTAILEGSPPVRIGRAVVGASEDSRPETLAFTAEGRHIFVASERDGGTLTLLDVEG